MLCRSIWNSLLTFTWHHRPEGIAMVTRQRLAVHLIRQQHVTAWAHRFVDWNGYVVYLACVGVPIKAHKVCVSHAWLIVLQAW